MLELLSVFESILRFISTLISTGYSVQKIVEIKNDNNWSDENVMFISSLIIGFVFGVMWSYFKK